MSNLTGLQNGVFNSLQLIDDTTGDATEVRQLFLQGSLEQSIPNNPTANQVLSIPGLLPELNARQLISNSYLNVDPIAAILYPPPIPIHIAPEYIFMNIISNIPIYGDVHTIHSLNPCCIHHISQYPVYIIHNP